MERQPALDGLRAVAVILVLLFHAGFTWMPAGYLGVSVFFTLSGFLITSLLLHEHAATGRISAREFYARRVRRLMPASLLCVTGIVVANFFGAFRGVSGLRTDLLASVFQVFNWVQLAGTTSYGDLFGGASSPFEHMWSLSIEEQAYWVWPLAVVALVAVAGRRRIHAMAALFVVLSAGAVVIARLWGPDAAYWATPARLPEIAAGAVLACAMVGGARVPTWAKWWAPAALAGIIVLSVEWPPASGPAYEGALPLVAMASASLLWGLQVDGPLRTLLSCRPLVWLGGISYGVYLFHWPVFVILRERGWVLDSTGGFGAAAAITLAVSVVSWQLVEMPVRRARRPSLATLRLGFAGTIVAAATASLLTISPSGVVASSDAFQRATAGSVDSLPGLAPGTTTTTTGAAGSVVATTVTASTITTTTVPSDRLPLAVPLPPAPSRPVRVMVVGDSTAFYVAEGLANFATTHPTSPPST